MPRTTDLPKDEILTRYAAGESIAALAAAYGRAGATMRENLHRWGAAVRRRGPPRRYSLDERFFQPIETEARAYWLGFILADGCIAQTGAGNYVCRVDLAVADREQLEKLAAAVGTDSPIKPGHHGASAYLDICSVRLCKDLIDCGCGPNKTGNHGTPVIAEHLKRHFYRGYVDGDGSLYPISQLRAWRFDTVGATAFIVDFQRWLMLHADVRRTKLQRARCIADVSSVRYTGAPQIERIARLLYDDATIFLDRKYQRYLDVCRRHKQAA